MDGFLLKFSLAAVAFVVAVAIPTERLAPFSCYSCVDMPEHEICNQTTVCQKGHEHCMTQYHYEEDGSLLVTTGCSHMHICMNKEENNADECYWDETGGWEGACTFCCQDSMCNERARQEEANDDNGNKPNSKGKPNSKATKPASKGKPNSKATKPASEGKPNSKATKPASKGKPNSKATKPASNGKPNSKATKPASNGKPNSKATKPNSRPKPTRPSNNRPSQPGKPQAPQTNPPATQGPPAATQAPQTNPPATQAPPNKPNGGSSSGGNSGGSSSGENDGNKKPCHSHNGRPCCKNHGPSINVDVHVHIDGGNIGVDCPLCNGGSGQKPSVNKNTSAPTTAKPTTAKPTTAQPTTAQPTTTTAQPTTTTTTQPTTITTTSPKPTFSCYTCKDTVCAKQELTSCQSGSEYCMTTIVQDKDGKRQFTKGCVTESVCKNKWWLATAPNPDCLLNMDDSATGLQNQPMTCSFCCVTKECNKQAVPEFTSFYTASRRR